MTPMVDLAFLLLTFFVMTTTLNKPQTMEITMPEEDEKEPPKVNEKHVLTLVMGKNDKIFWYIGITDPEVKVTNFSHTGIRKLLLEKKRNIPKLIVLIKSLLAVLVIAGPTLAELFRSKDTGHDSKKDLSRVVTLDQPPPIMPNTPPPPRVEVPTPVKTLKYVAPKVTKEEVVEEEIPTIEEIKKVEVSTETTEGPETVVFEEPVKEVVDNGDDQIYTVVEQQPEFPGGMEAMM